MLLEGSWRGEGGARARVRRGEAKTKKEGKRRAVGGARRPGRRGRQGREGARGREAILWDETRESRIWFIFEVGRLPAFVVTLKPLTRTH